LRGKPTDSGKFAIKVAGKVLDDGVAPTGGGSFFSDRLAESQ
jgi:hypothetical protein